MCLRGLCCLLIAALTACARSSQSGLPAVPQNTSVRVLGQAGYQSLYSFSGYPSGATPSNLTFFHNAFYGTTQNGGAKTFGTVFVRAGSGVQILHSFTGSGDGANPTGTLVPLGGRLYGFTEYGGAGGDGTVFSIGQKGSEKVVYSFKGGSDGATPVFGDIVVISGTLYGTTSAGGNSGCKEGLGCGVIFSLSSTGSERVLYHFRGRPDGAAPIGPLINVSGTLYGTTSAGGRYGAGTIFKVTTGGSEKILYSFKGFPDGSGPYAGLTDLDGTFYGTTAFGGSYDDSGTVFSLSASGVERVLHSFAGYPDGALPYAPLTVVDGTLYGTTEFGGHSGEKCTGRGVIGCGVIFSITTAGQETVVYRFKGQPDGSTPWSSLVPANGELYGTTVIGGKYGEGSIYSLNAPALRTR